MARELKPHGSRPAIEVLGDILDNDSILTFYLGHSRESSADEVRLDLNATALGVLLRSGRLAGYVGMAASPSGRGEQRLSSILLRNLRDLRTCRSVASGFSHSARQRGVRWKGDRAEDPLHGSLSPSCSGDKEGEDMLSIRTRLLVCRVSDRGDWRVGVSANKLPRPERQPDWRRYHGDDSADPAIPVIVVVSTNR
jgi:hypothetical protein